MRVFIDTNVILEKFLEREECVIVNQFFKTLKIQNHKPLMSVGAFYTMIFVVDKYLKSELRLTGEDRLFMLRRIMSDILQTINVAGHDKESLLRGVNNAEFKIIEDGCQYELAQKHGCEVLITFNTSDYPSGKDRAVKVFTPQQYIDSCSG